MQERKKWINPYITLIQTKPDYIVFGERDKLSTEQITAIREKCTHFSDVICEVCCGSGGHLVELAQDNPDTLFLGFELRFKRAFNIAKKAERLSLNNILAVRTDANFISQIFPQKFLAGVYINFPDPWELEKWKKFRILQPAYIDLLATLIRDRGFFSYKTDHLNYFESTAKIIAQHPHYQITELVHDLYKDNPIPKRGVTEFEKMFHSKGMPIYYLKASIK
ncbi:MAG: tRNA (guanosine(46)-N7)-methyltransferase TrmB [Bdellovibrionota bacterium]|jgi:tRNA (guanine-N7-)-methyltransferase